MTNNKKISIAIIPARLGSKRIPKKNIKSFHGKPIIAYSIEAALKSGLFDKVVVSTDCQEIANIAKYYGAETPFMRPTKLADDYVSSGDAVSYTLNKLQESGANYQYLCTIYPTAPFLQAKYLIEAFNELKNNNIHQVLSVASMPFPIQRTFKITSNNRCKMFTPEFFSARSQDLDEAYQDAGQFYWINLKIKPKNIGFNNDCIPIILPRYLVQDIDTPEDWIQAELLFHAIQQREKKNGF